MIHKDVEDAKREVAVDVYYTEAILKDGTFMKKLFVALALDDDAEAFLSFVDQRLEAEKEEESMDVKGEHWRLSIPNPPEMLEVRRRCS